jgi:hypothetical protein
MKSMARVKVEIEIDLYREWGLECALEQVKKQAVSDAMQSLTLALQDRPNIRIGKSEVILLFIPVQ